MIDAFLLIVYSWQPVCAHSPADQAPDSGAFYKTKGRSSARIVPPVETALLRCSEFK